MTRHAVGATRDAGRQDFVIGSGDKRPTRRQNVRECARADFDFERAAVLRDDVPPARQRAQRGAALGALARRLRRRKQRVVAQLAPFRRDLARLLETGGMITF